MANQYPKISRENRLLAKQKGEKIYLSGTLCKKCGSYERYVSNYACVPCTIKIGLYKLNNDELMKPYRTKEKGKIRLDRWRKQNPEKYQKQYKNNEYRIKRKKYYNDNKLRFKNSYLNRLYNITLDNYLTLLESQNSKCKICNKICSTGKNLSVDHDHQTGKVRGLLCKNCNIGLGMFFDNIDFLESAVLYLKCSSGE